LSEGVLFPASGRGGSAEAQSRTLPTWMWCTGREREREREREEREERERREREDVVYGLTSHLEAVKMLEALGVGFIVSGKCLYGLRLTFGFRGLGLRVLPVRFMGCGLRVAGYGLWLTVHSAATAVFTDAVHLNYLY
jgi:hypothetical protein